MKTDVINPAFVMRLAARLPRYTSYPTANHFLDSVGPSDYRNWLTALNDKVVLSLYLHIPFCESLCWYCACSTKATRRYEPVAQYLTTLETEILTVSELVPQRHQLSHLHWGGGSPDILSTDDILRLGLTLRNSFRLCDETEFAVEIDPRLMTGDKADSLVEIGVNRISIGIQDFDPVVQRAIGRMQSYEVSKGAIDLFRDRGVGSINVDLVYGLPNQSEQTLAQTIEQVLSLSPDRIAIFGYAHLPQRAHNQRLIDEAALPGPIERFLLSRRLVALLEQAGYLQLGLDHFARRGDSLATQPLRRNFQGYTTDHADTLIGLGASAIGRLPQGYVQNAVAIADYANRMEQQGFATARGWAMTSEDRLRAFVIERLMCDFAFSSDAVTSHFGDQAQELLPEAAAILEDDSDGFIERTHDGFRLTPRGRPFVRNICARFDAYLRTGAGGARHSLSI